MKDDRFFFNTSVDGIESRCQVNAKQFPPTVKWLTNNMIRCRKQQP